MAPGDRARAAGVSASSFLDLKAELANRENEYAKTKSRSAKDEGKKSKGTVWARTNKGVAARRERDIAALAADRATTESARAALEKKAAIYEKLKKGMTGGLSEAQVDALLVDFDAKEDDYESDSDDVDESLTVPKPLDEDDPLVEYEDEFGRMRTARRSEVPRNLQPSQQEQVDDDPYIEYNPINHFPVYEPSAERVAAIQEAASEAANPLNVHYDSARENRAKGAAFYTFSKDEEERAKEMEALRKAREETETARREMGATDVRPGESEGLASTGGKKENEKSRAMEKRKREIEERRKLVEAKRRKLKGLPEVEEKAKEEVKKVDPPDPFAALEAQTQKPTPAPDSTGHVEGRKSRWDETLGDRQKQKPGRNAADDFLAKLELDLAFRKASS